MVIVVLFGLPVCEILQLPKACIKREVKPSMDKEGRIKITLVIFTMILCVFAL